VLYFRVMKVQVRAGNSSYEAVVGSELINGAGSLIAEKLGTVRCAVIADSNIADLFAPALEQSLNKSGIQPILFRVPAGEESKSLEQVGMICEQMLAAALDRQSLVIGLGGGVVGDISGFVAAIFQRGIPHVQIPTTLLAMVDSSIGGKTGVNTSAGKNLLGVIHHPLMVIDDINLLRTLPQREFKQGYAEIIKHGIIADAEMFEELKSIQASLLQPSDFDGQTLAPLIRRNIRIKSQSVVRDEMDRTGDRAVLNFGHTIGHGIERAGDYQTFRHGEAISLGMVAAAGISVKRAGLPAAERDAIIAMLRRFDLPIELPGNFPRREILSALKFDKKFQSGEIRFVVTPRIGSAYLATDVTLEDIEEAIAAL